MGVNIVNAQTSVYSTYNTDTAAKTKAAEENIDTTEITEEESGVIYEKSSDEESTSSSATYSVNKMSAEDRAALVKQLQADQESRQQQLVSIVQKMISGQASTYAKATGSTDIWKFLASGDYTVDAQTQAQAQQDISEDGYYGITQTSERLYDFACALAGDDVDKMKEMQEAMQKGFEEAMGAWGDDLPDICQKTIDAANEKFEEYYKSKGVSEEDE